MPKKLLIYNDFIGGMNKKSHPQTLVNNELVLVEGMLCDEVGSMRTPNPPTKISGLTNMSATISPGRGLFSFKTDYTYSDTANTLSAVKKEYLCIADYATSEVDIYGYNDADDQNDHMVQEAAFDLGSGTNTLEAEYYYADGALRVSDASFDSGNTVQWFGRIGTASKKKLLGVELDREWLVKDNNLASPTRGLAAPVLMGTADAASSDNTHLSLASLSVQTGAITVMAAAVSGGTGYTKITSTGCDAKIDDGDIVIITGTTSYNGEFTVSSIDTNDFEIDTPFVDTDNTGSWLRKSGQSNFGGWTSNLADATGDSEWYLSFNDTDDQIEKIISSSGEILTTAGLPSAALWDNKLFRIYPYPGKGVLLEIIPSIGSNQGAWPAGEYEFGSTFIYEGGQESLIYKFTSNNISIDASEVFYARVTVSGVRVVGENNAVINERLIGGRVYARKSGSNNFWSLLFDMDFRVLDTGAGGGTRVNTIDDYDSWNVDDSGAGTSSFSEFTNSNFEGFYSQLYTIKKPNIESFENLNGFSSTEKEISFGATAGHGYKASTMAGSRVFVANVNYVDEDGNTGVNMGDTILYTPPNKYDTFPLSFKLDIAGNDGDEFVALEYSRGILFAFKKHSLFLIDISNPQEGGWRLIDKLPNVGVEGPWAVTQTPLGVAWVNQRGIYMFAEKSPVNLLDKKQTYKVWSDFYETSDTGPCIGYDSSSEKLLVINNCVDLNVAVIFDLVSGNWVRADLDTNPYWGLPYHATEGKITNMITFRGSEIQDGSNNLINSLGGILVYGDESSKGSDCDLYSIALFDDGSSAFEIKTKDEDFGTPHLFKKIYEINIEYITDNTGATIDIRYEQDGNDIVDSSSPIIATSQSLTGVSNYDNANNLNIKLSTPIKCRSFQLYLASNGTTAPQLKILSISYKHRVIKGSAVTETS